MDIHDQYMFTLRTILDWKDFKFLPKPYPLWN